MYYPFINKIVSLLNRSHFLFYIMHGKIYKISEITIVLTVYLEEPSINQNENSTNK